MALCAGIDIGSMAAKCVPVDEAGTMVAHALVPTGARVTTAAEPALHAAAQAGGVARGASALFDGTRTVIDIGGQDTKAIRIAANDDVVHFAMNDKCAAGTGRFLEVMALALGLNLDDRDELGPLSLQCEKAQTISGFCTVFGEFEVVSHVAGGSATADIARGIHESVAHRVAGLVRRAGAQASKAN
jgi:(R)-2-hydroxyacyl-CoA dehydratese activating ATPase